MHDAPRGARRASSGEVITAAIRQSTKRERQRGRRSAVREDVDLVVSLLEQPDAPEKQPDDCPPLLDGKELERNWPEAVGEVVQLRAEIVRSLDIASVLAQADGASFVVLVAPDAHWRGADSRWFSVLGALSVEVGGATRLPQLMLTQPGPCRTPSGALTRTPGTR